MNNDLAARRLRAWERFFATGEIDSDTIPSEIANSWRRSRAAGIDPHAPKAEVAWQPDELASRYHRNNALFDVAVPILQFLRSAVRETDFILVLTDDSGVVLDSYGSATAMARARLNNYVPGCRRDEATVGTNAIGLALIEKSPIQLTGAEHYNVRHHGWTCASAPTFSPTGELLGTITLSGQSSDAHPHSLGLVIAAAEAIQQRLKERSSEAERSRTEEFVRSLLRSVTDAIITVDASGRIDHVNSMAQRLLRAKEEHLVGRRLESCFSMPKDINVFAVRTGSPFELGYDIEGHHTYLIAKPIGMHENDISLGAILLLTPRREFLQHVRGSTGMSARYTLNDIVGRHPSIQRAIELAGIVARQESRVLVSGETGTGKELLVQGIHNASERASGPFVALNCAAIPHELIEAELFGYKEGAFTGSRRGGQIGKLELADGGTLFLDEISQMPYDMQAKLLRVLQDGMVTRLGDTKAARVDVRIIAASNEDLLEKSQNKGFRLDLYFRLSVVEINLPALRDRGEDVILLSRTILHRLCERMDRPLMELSAAAEEMLLAHSWPGNVRELENVLEMAAIICDSRVITPADLSIRACAVGDGASAGRGLRVPARGSGDIAPGILPMRDFEAKVIRQAVEEYGGNVSEAARKLGVSRSTVYRKMREYGLNREVHIS